MESPQESQTDIISSSKVQKFQKIFSPFIKSKSGVISLVVVATIILSVGIILFLNYRSTKQYEKNLKEFVVEASKSAMTSGYVCEDLRSVWSGYIFDDKKYYKRSTGTFTRSSWEADDYCSDFSEAVNKKIKWNEEHLSSELSEPYYTAKRLYKEMTPPPGKYKDTHVYVKNMFKAMEKLHDLSTNPTGNLSSYSSNVNETLEEFTSALSDLNIESDIDLSKTE